jgi:hypothetical protein
MKGSHSLPLPHRLSAKAGENAMAAPSMSPERDASFRFRIGAALAQLVRRNDYAQSQHGGNSDALFTLKQGCGSDEWNIT